MNGRNDSYIDDEDQRQLAFGWKRRKFAELGHSCEVEWNPTPEEIRLMSLRIQSEWTEEERLKRACGRTIFYVAVIPSYTRVGRHNGSPIYRRDT